MSKIEELAANPHAGRNVKRLVDFDAAAYRLRVGDYRILYDLVEAYRLM